MMSLETTDDMQALLAVLPPDIADALTHTDRFEDLLEIVLDLGRESNARYVDGEVRLTEHEITWDEIDYVVSRTGAFGEDNRAGIERTLHRISAIRNRTGRIVGLTCRVGRAVFGTIDVIEDMVTSGQSILLLGRPGVGKTTMLREVARVLAEKRRVVIVDTSNEIGGDGDIPHPAIGRARRMQVPTPSLQHAVMIEAVENHMPEVIVIDEIGTELEAAAARTIAERGVQLVGTAHGNTLDNLMMNPTLCDLVGGIQTVTLSDEEARRRGTQKSVLERKAPPTFDVVVEIRDWNRVAVRDDVAGAVDAILRGQTTPVEVRVRMPDGEIRRSREQENQTAEIDQRHVEEAAMPAPSRPRDARAPETLRVYAYGLNRDRLRQTSRRMNLPVTIAASLAEANALLTLRTYYRQRPRVIAEAEQRNIPVYVLRNNTSAQMERFLADIFGVQPNGAETMNALAETRQAILEVSAGEQHAVQLSPQDARTRRLQHELAREANLASYSSGSEPTRRVTVHDTH